MSFRNFAIDWRGGKMNARHSRLDGLFAVCLALAIALLPGPGSAATPPSGAVSQANPDVTWTGPLLTPTASSTCNGPNDPSCDNFKLTIAPPDQSFGPYKVVIQTVSALSGDWDLQVYDPNGHVVGSSGNGAGTPINPEVEQVVLTNPPAGIYTVSAAPFAPMAGADGTSYHGSASLLKLSSASPAPQGTAPTPRYQLYTPPPQPYPATCSTTVTIDCGLGLNAGEPSIGLNWSTGKAMYQSDVQTLRFTFFDGSDFPNPRVLVEDKSAVASQEDSDPILITDSRTGRTFVTLNLLATGRSEQSYSDNDGDLWIPNSSGGFPASIDHQSVGAGPYASPLTGTVYPDAVYYCSQLPDAVCSRSDDGGAHYGPSVVIYQSECGGLHGHVKVAPDGTVYVPNKDCGGQEGVVVSHDNGMTWTVRIVPGSKPSSSDPSLGIGSGGRIYLGYADNDTTPVIAASDDQGKTWHQPLDVGWPFHINNVFFAEVTAGDNDRVAFAFLGTSTTGGSQDPSFSGVWHLYVSHTYDRGLTWQTVDATPNAPVQRGPLWLQGGAVVYRNLLDFNDAQVDKQGRVHVAYAAGCAGAECAQTPGSAVGNAYTSFATIARQTGGLGLFAFYDTPNTPTVPGPPFVTAGRNGQTVYLGWSEADDGGSPIQNYQIFRGTTSGGESSIPIATVPGSVHEYNDAAATDVTVPKYYYRVKAINAPGSSIGNNEVYAKYVGDSCAGYAVNFDPAGDQRGFPANSDLDLLSVFVSEPPPDKLKFVMNVSSLAPPNPLMPNQLTPNRRWRIIWAYPTPSCTTATCGADAPHIGQYYVGMKTDNMGNPTFDYGTVVNGTNPGIGLVGLPTENPLGTPDSGAFAPDGTITIVIAKSKVGSPQGGDLLGRIRGLTFADSSNELRSTLQFDNPSNGTANDQTADSAVYVIRNPACAP
jgi:hypothetical protein